MGYYNARRPIDRLKHFLLSEEWNIGFVEFDKDKILSQDRLEVKYIKSYYRNKWFADPFILDITPEKIVLLAEEFDNKINRGRIAKLVVDKKTYKIESIKILLDLSTHLSFPAIYKTDEGIFICPENYSSGKSILYEYNEANDTLTPRQVLVNAPLTDAIICDFFAKPYIFTTQMPVPNGNTIFIYSSNTWNGKYTLVDKFECKDNSARSAGYLFKIDDKVMRPAQDCNGRYGKGVVLQEVQLQNGHFVFKELKRFYPQKQWLGLHTFNVCRNTAVVDSKRPKYPIFYNMLFSIYKIYDKISKD